MSVIYECEACLRQWSEADLAPVESSATPPGEAAQIGECPSCACPWFEYIVGVRQGIALEGFH